MTNNVLVIAAHSDDEALGCGGTISKLASNGSNITVLFMTDGVSSRKSADRNGSSKLRKLNSEKAGKILGISNIIQLDYPDNGMDSVPLLDVTKSIEAAIKQCQPSIVYTHYIDDLNIDHAITARASLTATRPMAGSYVKSVLGYEVNSSTEWSFGSRQFSPNYFVNVTESFADKINALRAYEKELREYPHPRSIEGITALATVRGSTSGFKFAEGFEVYRILEK